MLAARHVVRIAPIGRKPRLPHRLGETREHRVLVGAHHDHLAVRGRIDVGRRGLGQDRPAAFAYRAALGVLGHCRLHHGKDGLVDRRVDHLALAAVLAIVQRREGADAGERGGQRVPDGEPDAARGPVGIAGQVADAAHGFADGPVTRTARVRPGLPEPRHPHHHQPLVDGGERAEVEAPLLQRPGPKVLYQHIGARDEVPEQLLAAGLTQVEGDGLLVARDDRPPHRQPATPGTHGVTGAGRLDLDDLGAHVAEELAAERARDQGPELEDADVRQRADGASPGR